MAAESRCRAANCPAAPARSTKWRSCAARRRIFDTWAQMEKRGLELPRRPGRRLPLRQWPGDYAGIDLQRRTRRWRETDSKPQVPGSEWTCPPRAAVRQLLMADMTLELAETYMAGIGDAAGHWCEWTRRWRETVRTAGPR